jgi:hypothetical protein
MVTTLKAAKDKCVATANDVRHEYPSFHFTFRAVFYRDPVDRRDGNDYVQLSAGVDWAAAGIQKVWPGSRADDPEDWVGAYELALNRLK